MKTSLKKRGLAMATTIHIANELDRYLEYLPHNDTYLIRNLDGRYFLADEYAEIYRRWGNSHIYVGFHGESIIRMEPHIIPCPQRIKIDGSKSICPGFNRVSMARMVAECWHDYFTPNSIVLKKERIAVHPYARDNLYLHPTHHLKNPVVRNPMQYDCLSGPIELV